MSKQEGSDSVCNKSLKLLSSETYSLSSSLYKESGSTYGFSETGAPSASPLYHLLLLLLFLLGHPFSILAHVVFLLKQGAVLLSRLVIWVQTILLP